MGDGSFKTGMRAGFRAGKRGRRLARFRIRSVVGTAHQNFKGVGRRVCGQSHSLSGLFQSEPVGDQGAHIHFAGKDQPGNFALQGEVG